MAGGGTDGCFTKPAATPSQELHTCLHTRLRYAHSLHRHVHAHTHTHTAQRQGKAMPCRAGQATCVNPCNAGSICQHTVRLIAHHTQQKTTHIGRRLWNTQAHSTRHTPCFTSATCSSRSALSLCCANSGRRHPLLQRNIRPFSAAPNAALHTTACRASHAQCCSEL